MTFPTVSFETTQAGNAATQVNANMPSGIVAGDVLVAFVYQEGTSAWTAAGWSIAANTLNGSRDLICTRLATGSGDTLVVDRAAGAGFASIVVYRFGGVTGGLSGVEWAFGSTVDTNSNAPAVTASWGGADNLFLWYSRNGNGLTDYPAGYDLLQNLSGTEGSVGFVKLAGKQSTSATDDPAAVSGIYGYYGNATMVVRGSGGGATQALAGSAAAIASATGSLSVTGAGTITTQPLKNRSGTVLASTAIPKLTWLRLSDMQQMATWTNVSTNGSGVLSLSAAGVAVGVPGLLVLSDADGANRGVGVYTPT